MLSERQEAARHISDQLSMLTRQARNVGLETLAYLLDAARLEANQHFNWHEEDKGPTLSPQVVMDSRHSANQRTDRMRKPRATIST